MKICREWQVSITLHFFIYSPNRSFVAHAMIDAGLAIGEGEEEGDRRRMKKIRCRRPVMETMM